MIRIDGDFGEGGGQIVRTALALSLVTARPFSIDHIRAGRQKPGLMRQHLTAVNAAARIGRARVRGNALGSSAFDFEPGPLQPGAYRFQVGTAGSCSLVFQTLLPALLRADGPSELILEGGTHNPWAPPFDFLQKTFIPLINRMGATVQAELERPGFYPAGGGRMRVSIQPTPVLKPLDLLARGRILSRKASAVVSNLPISIARRELQAVARDLKWEPENLSAVEVKTAKGPGNILIIEIDSDALTEVFCGFGRRGVRAETVAAQTIAEVRQYLYRDVPVGRHLADQLLIPLALAGRGKFRTVAPTNHTSTNIAIIRKFLDVGIRLAACDDDVWLVEILPALSASAQR